MTHNSQYDLNNAPWCFQKPTPEQMENFDSHFSKAVLFQFFAMLRTCDNLSHHAVIVPELGGITAGEMAIMHLRADMAIRKKRKLQKKYPLKKPTHKSHTKTESMWKKLREQ